MLVELFWNTKIAVTFKLTLSAILATHLDDGFFCYVCCQFNAVVTVCFTGIYLVSHMIFDIVTVASVRADVDPVLGNMP